MGNQVVTQAVVTEQAALRGSQAALPLALFNADGTPMTLEGTTPQTGADVVLTGYAAGTAAAVAATDSVNEAIAKLEARIVELETP